MGVEQEVFQDRSFHPDLLAEMEARFENLTDVLGVL